MENEKTSDPRRVRVDETQVLEEIDLVEVDPRAPEAVNRGWVPGDSAARRVDAAALPVDDATHPMAAIDPLPSVIIADQGEPTVDMRAVADPRPRAAHPGAPSESPAGGGEASTWSTDDVRWAREADALAAAQPTRAALLLAFRARAAVDLAGDAALAEEALARAAELAPDARAVGTTRRRLAEKTGDAAAVAAALRAELPLAGDALERAGLLWQIAVIEQYAAGAADAALAALRELAGLDPQDLGAVVQLAALAAHQASWRPAAEAWETVAARTDDLAVRAALHTAAAGARECHLGDAAAARAGLERALEADDSNAAAQAALEALHLRGGAWTDYARLLVAEAERVGDLEPGLAYHGRAGDVLWECLGDGPTAAAWYQRAAAHAPDDVVALGKLAALYEQDGRYGELVGVYEQLARRIADPLRKAGVLLRLGTLYENRLDRPDDALAAYQKALDAAPTLAAAAQSLAAHYQTRGWWAELSALLLIEADRLTVPAQRAARYAAVAEMREVQQGGGDDVAALYERALSLDPGQAAALEGLDRIYRARERWQPLVALYEQVLAQAREPRRIRALRLTLAGLYQERLAAPERAAAHLRAVLAAPSASGPSEEDFAALVALGRALADAGQWADHVAVLERQAALLGDEDDAVATLYRAATVIETRLHDPARALAGYERVLDRAPGHAQAQSAILRLERGQSRWEALRAAERRLLDGTERAEEAAAILYRIGQIAEEHLGQPGEAIAAYEDALARLPSYRLARVGLERLLRGQKQFHRLADLFEQQAQAAADSVEQARVLCQAALVRELHAEGPQNRQPATGNWRLATGDGAGGRAAGGRAARPASVGDEGWNLAAGEPRKAAGNEMSAGRQAESSPVAGRQFSAGPEPAPELDAARALYERALALCPDFPIALWGLVRIGERCGDWGGAATALAGLADHATHPLARSRLLVRLARLNELRLDESARAAELYGEALAIHADSPAIFDRLRVSLVGDAGDAPGWLEQAAQATSDPRLAAGLLRMRAAAIEYGSGDRGAAAEAYAAAALRSSDTRALEGLARNLPAGTDDERLAYALAARGRLLRDAGARGVLLCVASGLYERTGHAADAEVVLQEALAAAPDFLPALAGRKRLREQEGDWAAAAALCAEMGALARDRQNRVELFEEAALLCLDRLGDLSAAAQHYRAVLAAQPGHPGALDRTLEILEQTGDWAEAVALLSEQVQAAADDQARARLLGLRARILAERLGDAHAAIADIERAVRLHSDPSDLLGLLAELHEATGHWADAALAFERLAHAATDPQAVRAAQLAQARIWTDAVPDYPRAQRILEEAVALDPHDRPTLTRLAMVALRAGDHARAAQICQELTESGTIEDRANTFVALAELRAELGDPAAEGAAWAGAFDLAADAPAIAALLEGHFRARGDLAGYVALAEEALARMELRAPGSLPLRISLARILREELGAPERALEHLQQAARGHPKAQLPRIALAEAVAARDPDSAIAELRRIVEADPTDAASYHGLAAVCRARGWNAPAWLMSTAAALLGGEPVSADLEAAMAAAPPAPPGSLPPEDALRFLVRPTQDSPVREILYHLDPYLSAIFPDGQELVAMLEPLPDVEPAAQQALAVALALMAPAIDIMRGDAGDPLLLLSEPRAIALGPLHIAGGSAGLARTRFDAAYALSRLAAGSAVGHVVEPDRVQALLRVATDPEAADPPHREIRRRLTSAMPRRARKDLERAADETGVIDQRRWAAWEQEERRRARRAGVLFACDLRAVAGSLAPEAAAAPSHEQRRSLLAASDAMLDALRFAASDACWSLCRRLFGTG